MLIRNSHIIITLSTPRYHLNTLHISFNTLIPSHLILMSTSQRKIGILIIWIQFDPFLEICYGFFIILKFFKIYFSYAAYGISIFRFRKLYKLYNVFCFFFLFKLSKTKCHIHISLIITIIKIKDLLIPLNSLIILLIQKIMVPHIQIIFKFFRVPIDGLL